MAQSDTTPVRRPERTRMPGFFSDLLKKLGVRHTRAYSGRRFGCMPFMTMFGLTNLAKEYHIATKGVSLGDKSRIGCLPVPFVAPVRAGAWVIVTGVHKDTVKYTSAGVDETSPVQEFCDAWNGVALLVAADRQSEEPHYLCHRMAEIMTKVRDVGIIAGLAALVLYCFIAHGLYRDWSLFGLTVFNMVGWAASFMLAQKTIGIHTQVSDNICSVIQDHGCDHVIKRGGTFFGIFHWSEVGLGYFTVSLIALLADPAGCLPWLALYNACCLPYTIWSVSYQKFVARSWCTLCLTVQATLWVLFGFYLGAHAWSGIDSFSATAIILPVCYVTTVFILNRLLAMLTPPSDDNDEL